MFATTFINPIFLLHRPVYTSTHAHNPAEFVRILCNPDLGSGGYNVTYLVLSQQLFYEDVFVLNTSFPLGELVQLNEVLECIQHMRNYVEQFWNLQNTFQSAALQSAIEPARCPPSCSFSTPGSKVKSNF